MAKSKKKNPSSEKPKSKEREILIQVPRESSGVKTTHVARIKRMMLAADATQTEQDKAESIFNQNFQIGNYRHTGTAGMDTPIYTQIYDFKIKFETI